jgi:hypothetical protein
VALRGVDFADHGRRKGGDAHFGRIGPGAHARGARVCWARAGDDSCATCTSPTA